MVEVDGRATRIVGVLPPRTELLNRSIDIWIPLRLSPATAGSRADHRYTVVARRKPGVAMAAAAADLTAAVARWQTVTGEFHSPAPGVHPLEMRRLSEATSGAVARPLAALAAAVGLVLLIACANVANLMLARAEGRRADLAIELALGAGIRHLAGLYLAEAIVLAALGGAGGLALAALGIDALKAFGPALVKPDDVVINARVLTFAAAAAVATAAVIAIAPMLRVDAMRARHGMQAGGRGAIGGGDRGRLQHALVAIQIALAVALSVGGLLTVRSLLALTRVDAGFRAEAVLRAQVSLPDASYAADDQVWDFYDRLLQRTRTLPGVRDAAVMSGLPPIRPANNTTFMLDGAVMFDHANIPQVEFVQHVSPGYFAVMGVPLRAGRAFTDADTGRGGPRRDRQRDAGAAVLARAVRARASSAARRPRHALVHRRRRRGRRAAGGPAGPGRSGALRAAPAGAGAVLDLHAPRHEPRRLGGQRSPVAGAVAAAPGPRARSRGRGLRRRPDERRRVARDRAAPPADGAAHHVRRSRGAPGRGRRLRGGGGRRRGEDGGVRRAHRARRDTARRDRTGAAVERRRDRDGPRRRVRGRLARDQVSGGDPLRSAGLDPGPAGGRVRILLAVALAAITIPAIRATRVDPLEALRTQ